MSGFELSQLICSWLFANSRFRYRAWWLYSTSRWCLDMHPRHLSEVRANSLSSYFPETIMLNWEFKCSKLAASKSLLKQSWPNILSIACCSVPSLWPDSAENISYIQLHSSIGRIALVFTQNMPPTGKNSLPAHFTCSKPGK